VRWCERLWFDGGSFPGAWLLLINVGLNHFFNQRFFALDFDKTTTASTSHIFTPAFPPMRVVGAADLGLEIPDCRQQSLIVLLTPHQSCKRASFSSPASFIFEAQFRSKPRESLSQNMRNCGILLA